MMKSSELGEYIKKNAKHNSNGTYEVRNICFEVDVPYVLSYLDEGVGLDWYEKVYEPVSEPQIDGVVAKLKANKLNRQAQIISSILSINGVDFYNKNVIVDSCKTLQEKTICELVTKTFKNISFFDAECLDENELKTKFENADIIISLISKPNYIKWCKDGVIVFDYSKMIYDNDKTESNFDDFIKEKISLYTYVDSGIYDLALTEICVNIAKAAFVYRD